MTESGSPRATMVRASRPESDRGSASLEVAVLIPLIGLLLAGLAAGWRIGWARTQLVEAAAAGTRAATVSVSAGAAANQGREAIEQDLRTVGLHCASLEIELDTSAFALSPGDAGRVSAAVNCRLDLSDLLAPGLPGQIDLSASATEPLDTFRERQP